MGRDDELVAELKRAAELVLEAGVPESMRSVAFEAAFANLRPTEQAGAAGSTGQPRHRRRASEDSALDAKSAGDLDRIAEALGVDRFRIDAIYAIEAGDLKIVVGSKRLNPKKVEGAKDLAVLVVAGRQLGGWDDEWTETEAIRETCRDYGKFQSNHFAETIGELDAVLAVLGKGASRKVKLLRPGIDAAKELVERLTAPT
jgi:hypothetical protein